MHHYRTEKKLQKIKFFKNEFKKHLSKNKYSKKHYLKDTLYDFACSPSQISED